MFDATAPSCQPGAQGKSEDVANAILYLAATLFASVSAVLVAGGGAIA